jgi:hypothetical protein
MRLVASDTGSLDRASAVGRLTIQQGCDAFAQQIIDGAQFLLATYPHQYQN